VAALLSRSVDYPDSLAKILTPAQIQWLRETELQFRLGRKFASSVCLLHPKMVEVLSLSENTKQKIATVAARFDAKQKELLQPFEQARTARQNKLQMQLGDLISDQQLEIYFQFTGQNLREDLPPK